MKIVIGSVLKPYSDIRHYRKIGLSILSIPDSRIFILAREEATVKLQNNVVFLPVTSNKTRKRERLLAPFNFFYYLLKIQPATIIICTHELLWPSVIYKFFFQTKLVYDVQENYRLNILSNSTYPFYLKTPLSWIVSIKEDICANFIDIFLLAEKCYQTELPFLGSRSYIFENKSILKKQKPPFYFKNKEKINLLFSGTVAIENGVLEAIELAEQLFLTDHRYQLNLIGCCHNPTLLKVLEKKSKALPFLKLQISSSPISYDIIEEYIYSSDIGLISYRQQANFSNKIPTKLFEYLSVKLPVIIQVNKIWEEMCDKENAGFSIDFLNFDVAKIHHQIQNTVFYKNSYSGNSYNWKENEKNLQNLILGLT